jgi:hypothetical protein
MLEVRNDSWQTRGNMELQCRASQRVTTKKATRGTRVMRLDFGSSRMMPKDGFVVKFGMNEEQAMTKFANGQR